MSIISRGSSSAVDRKPYSGGGYNDLDYRISGSFLNCGVFTSRRWEARALARILPLRLRYPYREIVALAQGQMGAESKTSIGRLEMAVA
jgi:hypothetical protein